ncbi:hypothetical protein [Novipirellula aureliae]|nr:hypothetical protein [Novipirellula aureliae]
MSVLASPPAAATTSFVTAGREKLGQTPEVTKDVTVASLLKRYAPQYVKRHAAAAVPQVQSTNEV